MKSTKNIQPLKKFMESGIFYDSFFDIEETIEKIEKLKKKKIKLLYGETYDSYGLTIDSLKYYLILTSMHSLLEKCGFDVESHILVGDTASLRNDKVKNKEKIISQIEKNKILIRNVISEFNLKSELIVMSNVFDSSRYKQNFQRITKHVKNDSEIRNNLRKAVLKSKINEEEEKNFLYSREEIALILDYDVKIGPPRESNYDKIAQKLSHNLIGIYVKPTYPLGKNFDYFISNPEIEKFGITPYKAGSNRLEKNRIIIEKATRKEVKELIKSSFVPDNNELPNPVLDLAIFVDLTRRCRESDFESFVKYELNEDIVKTLPVKIDEITKRLK